MNKIILDGDFSWVDYSRDFKRCLVTKIVINMIKKISERILIVFVFFFINSLLFGQEYNISGNIIDAKSGEPIPFASVALKELSTGLSTNINGEFSVKIGLEKVTLIVSCIGYKTEEIIVTREKQNLGVTVHLLPTGVLLQEVTIYSGSKNSSSVQSLQNKQIHETSTVYPDVFRSIQALPGIAVNNEFSAKFNVRGGNYDENLVLVNNAQVYEPFHVKEAGNASIGIFNTDMMRKVNLIAGGFSAKYGDRLSSVLDIEYREGSREKLSGIASLSLTNFDGLIEGPVGSFGSFILGIRKSYVEYAMNFLDLKKELDISFYDIQGVLSIHHSQKFKTQLKFIHAGDYFKYNPEISEVGPFYSSGTINKEKVSLVQTTFEYDDEKATYFSNLIDLQGGYTFSSNALMNLSISYYEQSDYEFSNGYSNYSNVSDNLKYYTYSNWNKDYKNDLNIKTVEGKASFDLRINPYYDINAGVSYVDIVYDQYLLNRRYRIIKENIKTFPAVTETTYEESENPLPQTIAVGTFKTNGYVENIIQISDNLLTNVGVRLDYFDINRELTISPRLNLSYLFEGNIALRGAWGHYYQSPIYRQLAYPVSSYSNTKSTMAEHFILGIEKNFSFEEGSLQSFMAKIDFYYKKYSNLISSKIDSRGNIVYSRKNDSFGYASGFDLSLSASTSWYSGWINYGLLFANEDYNNDGKGYLSRYTDQRHTISFINSFNLGKDWGLNINFAYGSGFAYTPYFTAYDSKSKKEKWIEGERNSSHLPDYKRVDLRISKQFNLFGFRTNAFFEISNLFNFNNVYGYRYRFNKGGTPYREDLKLWPFIPSIGIKTEM